jgi:Rps23 Pro-64 3,4-dihydroxylase Tpa1-like proline 4-hydroxylase
VQHRTARIEQKCQNRPKTARIEQNRQNRTKPPEYNRIFFFVVMCKSVSVNKAMQKRRWAVPKRAVVGWKKSLTRIFLKIP